MSYRTETPSWPIDLPSEVVNLVIAERWETDYRLSDWHKRPAVRVTPEVGDRWAYGDVKPATRETASHVEIRHAAYSDYSGSDVEASNHRSLLRDYPDTFVDVYGDYGTTSLLLPVSCLDDAVLEAVSGLSDYPLYDEEDSSELVTEWTNDGITDYLRADIVHELSRAGREAESDAVSATGDDEMRRHVWSFYSDDASEYPYAEAVQTVVFPRSDELTEYVTDAVLRAWAVEITGQPANDQTTLA